MTPKERDEMIQKNFDHLMSVNDNYYKDYWYELAVLRAEFQYLHDDNDKLVNDRNRLQCKFDVLESKYKEILDAYADCASLLGYYVAKDE